MADVSSLHPDGQTVATNAGQVPLWSIILDVDGRIWERNGIPTGKVGSNWKFIAGSNRGLRYGYHMSGMVAFPVTILAQHTS